MFLTILAIYILIGCGIMLMIAKHSPDLPAVFNKYDDFAWVFGCCVDNLEWRTRSETILAAFDRGTRVPPRQIAIRVVETGESYPSIRSCARAIDCCQNDISGYFAGKRSSVKGYHFEYA